MISIDITRIGHKHHGWRTTQKSTCQGAETTRYRVQGRHAKGTGREQETKTMTRKSAEQAVRSRDEWVKAVRDLTASLSQDRSKAL